MQISGGCYGGFSIMMAISTRKMVASFASGGCKVNGSNLKVVMSRHLDIIITAEELGGAALQHMSAEDSRLTPQIDSGGCRTW